MAFKKITFAALIVLAVAVAASMRTVMAADHHAPAPAVTDAAANSPAPSVFDVTANSPAPGPSQSGATETLPAIGVLIGTSLATLFAFKSRG